MIQVEIYFSSYYSLRNINISSFKLELKSFANHFAFLECAFCDDSNFAITDVKA